jgi:hypothetical protein
MPIFHDQEPETLELLPTVAVPDTDTDNDVDMAAVQS